MRPKENFNVGLTNALLEPKHYHAMGDALWLYTYLLDRQTRRLDKDGLGQVAGGVPIRDADISGTIGSSRRTIIRWRDTLLLHGYVTARRTPYGHVYAIAKPKKWSQKTGTDVTQPAHLSKGGDVPFPPTDVTETVKRCDTTCTNKEEMSRETSSSSSETAAAAFSEKQMAECIEMVSNYYLKAFDTERIISPSEKQMASARLAEILPCVVKEHLNPRSLAGYMACAIDVAHHIVKIQPQKKYFAQWYAIFGKQKTFASLIDQHSNAENVPAAADLPDA